MQLKKNQTNSDIVLTLTEKTTIDNPTYLFGFSFQYRWESRSHFSLGKYLANFRSSKRHTHHYTGCHYSQSWCDIHALIKCGYIYSFILARHCFYRRYWIVFFIISWRCEIIDVGCSKIFSSQVELCMATKYR